ncbi:7737_t:CDS:2, partial [Entrophospora sp. SA101]
EEGENTEVVINILKGNESNSESIDTESDIDLDNYEYYDNHNRDIDFLIVDYLDLNNSLFNYKGSNENEIDISFNNEDRNCNENNNDDEIQSSEEINDGGEKISNDEISDNDDDIEINEDKKKKSKNTPKKKFTLRKRIKKEF